MSAATTATDTMDFDTWASAFNSDKYDAFLANVRLPRHDHRDATTGQFERCGYAEGDDCWTCRRRVTHGWCGQVESTGTKMCLACGEDRHMRAFPTVLGAVKVRGAVCRRCRDAR